MRAPPHPPDEPIPISALQHMLYCPRQCALIHNERQWAENAFTAEGRVLHERVDAGGRERRLGVTTGRSVPLRSDRLGLTGIADAVELRDDGRPYPVEYKRGSPKAHRADEVQLCAQGMCLEEMLDTVVPEGALYYGRTRRRQVVLFGSELRGFTEQVAERAHALFQSGRTPAPILEARKCAACSLRELCQPEIGDGSRHVERWVLAAIDA